MSVCVLPDFNRLNYFGAKIEQKHITKILIMNVWEKAAAAVQALSNSKKQTQSFKAGFTQARRETV